MADKKAVPGLMSLPLELRHTIFEHAAAAKNTKPESILRNWFEKKDVQAEVAKLVAADPNGPAPQIVYDDRVDHYIGEDENSEDEDEDNGDADDDPEEDEDEAQDDSDPEPDSGDAESDEDEAEILNGVYLPSALLGPHVSILADESVPQAVVQHQQHDGQEGADDLDDAMDIDMNATHIAETLEDEDDDEDVIMSDEEALEPTTQDRDEEADDTTTAPATRPGATATTTTAAASQPPLPRGPVVRPQRKWRHIPSFMRITHGPPPVELLLTSKILSNEAKDWFLDVTVLHIDATANFAHTTFFEEALTQIADAAFSPMETIRKVEITFVWDSSWIRADTGGIIAGVFPALLDQRAKFVHKILAHAPDLKQVIIHWHDSAQDNDSMNLMLDTTQDFHTLMAKVELKEHYIASDAKPHKRSVAGKRRVEFQNILDMGLDRLS